MTFYDYPRKEIAIFTGGFEHAIGMKYNKRLEGGQHVFECQDS